VNAAPEAFSNTTPAVQRGLCIALHDVAPATWPDCGALLRLLEPLGRPPVTLAVVPQYHGGARVDHAPWFVRDVNAHVAAGAEVALHGLRHLDDGADDSGGAVRGPADWLRRRMLTAGEGEFAALPLAEAEFRIRRGLDMLQACGWQAAGFIPPAWLAGRGTRAALERSSLAYTSSHWELLRLRDGARIAAPCITVSARSAWRRAASRLWVRTMREATAGVPLLRIALHPADARHPDVALRWQELIARLLESRTPMTKADAVRLFAPEPGLASAPSRMSRPHAPQSHEARMSGKTARLR